MSSALKRHSMRDNDAQVSASPRYDACVVGAGPAGSAAAMTLARAGARVLLLDARSFPRDKVCGDLLGTEAIASLTALGVTGIASDGFALDGARVYGPTGRYAGALSGAAPVRAAAARVITREVFDARLVSAAQHAAVTCAWECVRTVSNEGARGWTIATAAGTHRARVVIGADGYGSRVAAAVGRRPVRGRHLAVVVRAYARGVRGLGDAMHFFVNDVADGYGWLFPLGDGRANVGLGFVIGDGNETPNVHAAFARFVSPAGSARALLGDATIANPRAWPIPLGWHAGPVSRDGLFLAGDAAAVASPLSGSGISNALRSGMLAAHAAMRHLQGETNADSWYARQLAARFAPRLHAEHAMRLIAGTPQRIEPFLRLAHALPFGDRLLARALLKLG